MSDPLKGRLDHGIKRAIEKCANEQNQRFVKVLETGSVLESGYVDGKYIFAFTAKKFISLPGDGSYLIREFWEPLTVEEIADQLIDLLGVADQHGYMEPEEKPD